jgi:hypothetical protein
MSFLSDALGGGAQDAANSQIAGLTNGEIIADTYLNSNPGIIQSFGSQAQQPFQSNFNTASSGLTGSSNSLANLLGLNGAAGSQSALTSLQTTPGYQFSLGQGDSAINASAAANGTLNSGNQMTALSNYNQGLAGNTFNSAVSNAQGAVNSFGSLANSSANGLAGVLGGEATGLVNNNNTLAQLGQSTAAGIGNAQGSADLAKGQAASGLLGGALSLGGSLFGGAGGLSGLAGGLTGGLGGLFGGGAGGTISNGLDGLDILGGL